jgi:hypothetical protein
VRAARPIGTVVLFLATWALTAPSAIEAQAVVRRGFWAEGGVGTGTVRNSCGRCQSVTSAYGGTDYVRMGTSLAPRVLLGLEVFALSASDLVLGASTAPVEAVNRSVAPIVLWYVGRSGFFLKGGAGLARGTFRVPSPTGATTTERTGSALTFGIGFDVTVAPWFALTANLGTNVMAVGDVIVDGFPVDDIIATVYEASVGLTLR